MAFSAGDIEARLTLDRTPFQAGLRAARADGERFEREKFEAELGADATEFNAAVKRATAAGRRFEKRRFEAELGLNLSRGFFGQLGAARAAVASIPRKVTTTWDFDAGGGMAGAAAARAATAGLDRTIRTTTTSIARQRTETDRAGRSFFMLGRGSDSSSSALRRFGSVTGAVVKSVPVVISGATGMTAALGKVSDSLGDATTGMSSFGAAATQGVAGVAILATIITVAAGVIVPLVAGLTALVASLAAAVAGIGALGIAAAGALAPMAAFGFAVADAFQNPQKYGQEVVRNVKATEKAFKGLGNAARSAVKPGVQAFTGALAPAIKRVTPMVRELRPAFTQFGQAAGKAVGIVSKRLASMGPQFSKLIKGASDLAGPIARAFGGMLEILMKIANAAMPFLEKALRGIAQWLNDIAKNTSVKELSSGIETLVDHLGLWWDIAKSLGSTFLSIFKAGEPAIRDFVQWLADGAESLADWASSKQGQEDIKNFFEKTLPTVKSFVESIAGLVTDFIKLGEAVAPFFKFLSEASQLEIGDWLPKAGGLTQVIDALATVKGFLDDLKRGAQARIDFVARKVGDAWNWIKGSFRTVVTFVGRTAGKVWGWIKGAFRTVVTFVGRTVGDVWKWIKGAVRTVVNFVAKTAGGVWRWIKNAVKNVVNFVAKTVGGVWKWITNAVKNTISFAAKLAGGIWKWITDAVKNVIGFLAKQAGGIWKWITDAVKNVIGFTVQLLGDLWNLIRNPVQNTVNFVANLSGGGVIMDLLNKARGGFVLNGKVRGGPVEAKTGFLGRAGQKGKDRVLIAAGKGEAVLNSAQQAVVNRWGSVARGVGASRIGTLPQLFKTVRRKHNLGPGKFAGGGPVQAARGFQRRRRPRQEPRRSWRQERRQLLRMVRGFGEWAGVVEKLSTPGYARQLTKLARQITRRSGKGKGRAYRQQTQRLRTQARDLALQERRRQLTVQRAALDRLTAYTQAKSHHALSAFNALPGRGIQFEDERLRGSDIAVSPQVRQSISRVTPQGHELAREVHEHYEMTVQETGDVEGKARQYMAKVAQKRRSKGGPR